MQPRYLDLIKRSTSNYKRFLVNFFVTPFTATCVRYATYWPDAVAVRGLSAVFLADTPLFGDVPDESKRSSATLSSTRCSRRFGAVKACQS